MFMLPIGNENFASIRENKLAKKPKETHEVRSNRESGYGVYDVMLIPKDKSQLALILESKSVRDAKKDLQLAAQEALQQIKNRQYGAELKSRCFDKILSLGLAFHGKDVAVLAE